MTFPARTRAEAVVGWRYWQVTADAGPAWPERSVRLRSVTQRRIRWVPGQVLRAVCLVGRHRAPDEGCDCGIYAGLDLHSLRQFRLCLAPEALVVGQVALWGAVLPDVAGWRGEKAEPVSLSVVRELADTAFGPRRPAGGLDATVAALRTYGVPVDTIALDDAVAGVSAAILANQAMALTTSRPARPVDSP